MATSYAEMMTEYAAMYPLKTLNEPSAGRPEIAVPLSNRAVDSINSGDIAGIRSTLNPLKVEELVSSAMSRIASCMTLRDKAHQLQMLATGDAIEYRANKVIVLAQAELDKLKNDVNPEARNKADIEINKISGEKAEWNEAKKLASLDPGNGSNYSERYAFLIEMFDLNIRQAYARATQASEGMKLLYGVDRPLPELSGNLYLNRLAIWAQGISDDLDTHLDNEIHYCVAIGLNSGIPEDRQRQIFGLTEFNAKLVAKIFDFSLEPNLEINLLPGSRLRGIKLQVVTIDPAKPNYAKLSWNMQVTVPGQAYNLPILATTGDLGEYTFFDELYNASPFGHWTITIDSTSSSGSKDLIANVVAYLDLVVERQ